MTPKWASDSPGSAMNEPKVSFELREIMNPDGQNPSTPTQMGLPAAWQSIHPEP